MNHGELNVAHSNIKEEKQKMGENLKAMGRMAHRDPNEPVRKNDNNMRKTINLQIDEDMTPPH